MVNDAEATNAREKVNLLSLKFYPHPTCGQHVRGSNVKDTYLETCNHDTTSRRNLGCPW